MDNLFPKDKIGDVLIIDLNFPDATMKNAQTFKATIQQLVATGEKYIVIDCLKISYMDSTFLGSLVFSLKKLASVGGDLKLVIKNVESPVWTMFETTNMFRVFKYYEDRESAVKSFA